MKAGYLVVPNTAAAAVLRKRLIAQGAEEVTIDIEKHEQLTELLDTCDYTMRCLCNHRSCIKTI